MYRISYELGRINDTLGLSVAVIYHDDSNKPKVTKNTWNGNTTMSVKIYPYFVLRFYSSDEREEKYNKNRTQNINRLDAFHLIIQGRELMSRFRKAGELFQYMDGHLVVNKDLAKKISTIVNLKDGRKLLIQPIVVPDRETGSEFEGFVIFSNSYDVYALLTFDEFSFLLYTIEKTNIDSLSMQLIIYAESVERGENLETPSIPTIERPHRVITESGNEDEVHGMPLIQDNTLPDI